MPNSLPVMANLPRVATPSTTPPSKPLTGVNCNCVTRLPGCKASKAQQVCQHMKASVHLRVSSAGSHDAAGTVKPTCRYCWIQSSMKVQSRKLDPQSIAASIELLALQHCIFRECASRHEKAEVGADYGVKNMYIYSNGIRGCSAALDVSQPSLKP